MTVSPVQLDADQRRRVAEIVRHDPHAPRWHFIPPEGAVACFDPNGALFWRGRYHLFYIFQDPAYASGSEFPRLGHCWGHASSADLLHWTYHPAALVSAPGDPESAIYSGCAFITHEGVPALAYHGYGAGTCLAFAADDDLVTWRKSPHNPVIIEPQAGEPGFGIYNVFDPNIWREGEEYRAILGGQVKPHDRGDTAYLFTSRDLVHWLYQHPFYRPNPAWTGDGDDCACPDFFPLGDRHALLCISHATGARCYLGDYRDGIFTPTAHHRLNWPGGACFAPETLLDDTGRRLMWAWALHQQSGAGEAGALGVFTMPRVLSAQGDELLVTPPSEFAALRREHVFLDDLALTEVTLPLAGDSLELEVTAETDDILAVAVRMSPDRAEETVVRFDARAGEIAIDYRRSNLSDDAWRPYPLDYWRGFTPELVAVQRAPFHPPAGEPLRLRLFLDRSILEVFANDRLCLTARLYPTRADSTGVALRAEGGPVRLRRVDAWSLAGTTA